MIRKAVVTIALLGLTCAAHAELDKGTGFSDLERLDGLQQSQVEGLSRQVWTSVSDVASTDVARLMARVDEVLTDREGKVGMVELLKIQEEMTRQTRAFQSAYRTAAAGTADVDGLIGEVVDGTTPSVDVRYYKAVATRFETLYSQFGQFVNARFLASNAAGIPVYKRSAPAADAASVAEQARVHMNAYQANLTQVSGELRTLLNLEAANH